jgi:hypothetical protein
MNFNQLLELAEEGDSRAQYLVGWFNETGKECPRNTIKALEWYKKSASQNNGCALYSLGVMHEMGLEDFEKDIPEDLNYYQDGFEQLMLSQEDLFAQNILGLMYLYGRGVVKNEILAIEWFRKAAEQNNAEAQYELGEIYLHNNVLESLTKALEPGVNLKEKTTLQDLAKTLIAAERQAFIWFEKAGQQGSARAQCVLAEMYARGSGGIPMDEKLSVVWIQKGAQQGSVDALKSLGHLYTTGRVVAKDDAQAVVLFHKAAEQGDSEAHFLLAQMYRIGRGVPKNEEEAVVWYQKGAKLGDASSQCSLAQMYELGGGGLSKDNTQALFWYNKAAEQGNATAKTALETMNSSSPSFLHRTFIRKDNRSPETTPLVNSQPTFKKKY